MGNPARMRQNNQYAVGIALLTLASFLVLFLFRSLDDNRLTSWVWIFLHVNATGIFSFLIAGTACAYLLARLPLPVRHPLLLLFAVSFLAVALFWKEPEVIVDSARYFTQAKYLAQEGMAWFFREWGRQIDAWTDTPLVPFLYGVVFSLFGESRLCIQIFTATLFSLTTVLVGKTGELLWDRETGVVGGLLMLGIPYLYTQVPLMLVDVPAMFFFMTAVYVYLKAMRDGGGWTFIAPLAIVAAVLAKYSAVMMLTVLPVISMVIPAGRGEGAGRAAWYRTAGIFAMTAVVAGILALLYSEVLSGQMGLLLSFQKPGLGRWGESLLSSFFFQSHPFLAAAAIFSCYLAVKKRDRKFIIIAWLIFLVIVLQIRRVRYTIMVFPFLALMASYGIREIRDVFLRKYLALCIVASSLVIAFFAYLPFLQKVSTVNLQHAGTFLDAAGAGKVEVHTLLPEDPAGNLSVGVPILDLFTAAQIVSGDDQVVPMTEKMKKSSLRFTWEYRIPSYYLTQGRRAEIVAVISDDISQEIPPRLKKSLEGYALKKTFSSDEGAFRFRTMVSIYQRDSDMPEREQFQE